MIWDYPAQWMIWGYPLSWNPLYVENLTQHGSHDQELEQVRELCTESVIIIIIIIIIFWITDQYHPISVSLVIDIDPHPHSLCTFFAL